MIETIILPHGRIIPTDQAQMIAESATNGKKYALVTHAKQRSRWWIIVPRRIYDGEWIVTVWAAYRGIGLPVSMGRGRTLARAEQAMKADISLEKAPPGPFLSPALAAFVLALFVVFYGAALAFAHVRHIVAGLLGGLAGLVVHSMRRSQGKHRYSPVRSGESDGDLNRDDTGNERYHDDGND